MNDLIFAVELITKFATNFGTTGMVLMLSAIIVYSLRVNKKDKEDTNEKFERVMKMQEKMQIEYTEGLAEIDAKLAENNRITTLALETINSQQKENNLMTLRSIVTNTSLPVEYRLKNYDIYTGMGGNSWLNKYVIDEILNKIDEG